jgi:hypothetical protein
MNFLTKEDAIAFAEKQGISYVKPCINRRMGILYSRTTQQTI